MRADFFLLYISGFKEIFIRQLLTVKQVSNLLYFLCGKFMPKLPLFLYFPQGQKAVMNFAALGVPKKAFITFLFLRPCLEHVSFLPSSPFTPLPIHIWSSLPCLVLVKHNMASWFYLCGKQWYQTPLNDILPMPAMVPCVLSWFQVVAHLSSHI